MSALLRIISGKWRGRKIYFDNSEHLRPTRDIVRETLFNWISEKIINSICLDLFAGTGALGFEALSRGANKVIMVDSSRLIIKKLKNTSSILKTSCAECYCYRIPNDFHKINKQTYDIIFMDPPFFKNLIKPTCDMLVKHSCLSSKPIIYIESESNLSIEKIIPESWIFLQKKITGNVCSNLLKVTD